MATVGELKQHIASLEAETETFKEEISQLVATCKIVLEENQCLQAELESLEAQEVEARGCIHQICLSKIFTSVGTLPAPLYQCIKIFLKISRTERGHVVAGHVVAAQRGSDFLGLPDGGRVLLTVLHCTAQRNYAIFHGGGLLESKEDGALAQDPIPAAFSQMLLTLPEMGPGTPSLDISDECALPQRSTAGAPPANARARLVVMGRAQGTQLC